jgi:acetyl-CoA carboxylase alpha subunit
MHAQLGKLGSGSALACATTEETSGRQKSMKSRNEPEEKLILLKNPEQAKKAA